MLNKKKHNFLKKREKQIEPFVSNFFQYPKISNNNFVQTGNNKQLDWGVNVVFNQRNFKERSLRTVQTNRFKFNSKQFREFFIFNSATKDIKQLDKNKNLRRFIFFLDCVFKERKKIPFYLLKRIRGGYMISVLGAICFVPRSLFKFSLNQQLISFKVYKKARKFARPTLKLNLVSTLRQKKRNT